MKPPLRSRVLQRPLNHVVYIDTMAQGALGQDFLKSAGTGRVDHRETARAAAEAMNTSKPPRGAGSGGYSKGGEPFSGSAEPMKVNLKGTAQSGLDSTAEEYYPAEPSETVPPMPQDAFLGGAGAGADAQAALLQMQMSLGMQMGNPMFPQMNPWMMMDPNLMMQQMAMQQMAMPPGQMLFSGMQKPPGMMFGQNSGGGKGKSGKGPSGGDKSKGENNKDKKKKAKAKAVRPPSPPVVESEDANVKRCPSLVEIRKCQGKCALPIDVFISDIREIATDQYGSRFLQSKFDPKDPAACPEADRLKITQAILPHVRALASDQFGNFVVQKMFQHSGLGSEIKKQMADQLRGSVLSLSLDEYGCRVVQDALQHLPREHQQLLAQELRNDVGKCIENMHANHVIQKCIEQLPPDSVTFIIDEMNAKVDGWANHSYGCRVIQRLLEHCAPEQLEKMMDAIINSIHKMAKHPYGNYVVQHMLDHGRPKDKGQIMQIVGTKITDFSTHRCSSNVVEKCFEIAAVGEHAPQLDAQRRALYNSVLIGSASDGPPLFQMVDDKFGNYIVQSMIQYSKQDDRQRLFETLYNWEGRLEKSNNGKHILAALRKAQEAK